MDTPRVLELLEGKEELINLCPHIDKSVFAKYETQKFPMWVYKKKLMSQFGVFMESMVKYYLIKEYPESVDKTRCNWLFLSLQEISFRDAVKSLMGMADLPITEKVNPSLLEKVRNDVKKIFGPIVAQRNIIVLDYEILDGKVQGHPDILCTKGKNVGIIDVKTISKPATNSDKHVMQISAYAALMKRAGANVYYFGLYYPLHEEPLLCMTLPSNWDSEIFLNALTG